MLIVEGPDGAGKTTLVNRLMSHFGVGIEPRACTSDDGVDSKTLARWVENDMSRQQYSSGLYDRYPLFSEPIYGPLIRGRMADGFEDLGWLHRMNRALVARVPIVVWCLPPLNEVLENIDNNHQPTTEHLKGVLSCGPAIYAQYVQMAALNMMLHFSIHWDYTRAAQSDFDYICTQAVRRRALP